MLIYMLTFFMLVLIDDHPPEDLFVLVYIYLTINENASTDLYRYHCERPVITAAWIQFQQLHLHSFFKLKL